MRSIPQRELRNNVARVLRQVEAGERLRITVNGRPVADLVPAEPARRTFVARQHIEALLAQAPLDPGIAEDLTPLTAATIDEL